MSNPQSASTPEVSSVEESLPNSPPAAKPPRPAKQPVKAEVKGAKPESKPAVPTTPPSTEIRPEVVELADREVVDEIQNNDELSQQNAMATQLAEKMADVDVVVTTATKVTATCPAIGTKLRCDSFDGDTSVVCVVEMVVPEDGVFVVRIPALDNRLWPFSVERLAGDKLVYVPSDYPTLGANAKFDEKYRVHLRSSSLTNLEQGLIDKAAFSPPRKARAGHQWVKIVAGPVAAVCFDYHGKSAKGDHPMSKEPTASYIELAKATAKPLIAAGILLDCGTG